MASRSEEYLIKIQLQVQNDKALKALTTQLEKTAKAAPKAQKAMGNAGKSAKAFGRTTQNVSYQLQDLIVQIQGGTSASRALSQQLPQMLVGMGALGAAIGVVAAIMPVLIAQLAGAAKGSQALDEQLEGLNDEIGRLDQTVDQLDMKGWIDSFNKLDAQAKLLASSLLEVRLEAARLNFQQAIESFTSFADALLPAGRLADIQLQSMAKNLGLSVGALEQLMPLVKEFRDDPFGDPVNLEKMVALIKTAGVDAEPLLKRLQALKAAQDSLQTGTRVSGQASNLENIPTDETGRSKAAEDLKYIRARGKEYTGYQRMMNAELEKTKSIYAQLYPAATQYAKTQEMLNEAKQRGIITDERYNEELEKSTRVFEKAMEGFSLGDEALKLFDESFSTMLDGVLQGTQSLSDGFEDMAKTIIASLLKLAAYKGIASLFAGTAVGDSFSGLLSQSAKGNVISGGKVVPFAKGGIVGGPTLFPMKGGAGLMGEAGAEAILPLSRGPGGNLGVSAAPVNVTVNNMASGVRVNTRQTDQGLTLDVVLEAVASSVRQGGTEVSNAMEDKYSLSRGRAVY